MIAFLLAAAAAAWVPADEVPLRVLFLGDRGHHNPADFAALLTPALKERGIEVEYTENIRRALTPGTLSKYDALIVYANTERITPEQEAALVAYVEGGGGFVPIHCASFCFLNSPAYVALVGAQFQRHGAGEFDTEIVAPDHPIMKGYQPFHTWDETYVHAKHNESERTVLQVRADAEGREPWTWVRSQGKGRVFYTAYGHDERTWSQPGFVDLIERGIRWAADAGQGEAGVGAVDPARGFDPFYRKVVDLGGLPIMGSEEVSDFALLEAAHLLDNMLEGRADIAEALEKNGLRCVVMAYDERTTDVPEQREMQPKDFWDVRARGLGASRHTPVVSCGEENLLDYPGDPYKSENILIHEFAHAMHGLGLVDVDPTFDDRLKGAYEAALAEGKWKGTYAASNAAEYWAEGVQSWFDTNREPDFQHNEVNTREELKAYDPALAALIEEVYGDRPWRYELPADRSAGDRAHLEGYDASKAPRFSWGDAQRRYDEVVAEKKQRRAAESAGREGPR